LEVLEQNLNTPFAVEQASSHPKGRRKKSADRREEILDAASALYITYGPSKTTTRQIADAVGISQPSLYGHFPTKEALSQALATRAFTLLEERMESLPSPNEAMGNYLATLINSYIAFALEETAAYRIAFMIDLNLSLEHIESFQKLVGLQAFAIFRDKIALLQTHDCVKAGPIDMIAQSIWAAMHGLCALLIARPLFPWAQRDELIAFHTQLIVKGAQT
jgi:AcrR family transcriptional regulator